MVEQLWAYHFAVFPQAAMPKVNLRLAWQLATELAGHPQQQSGRVQWSPQGL